MWQSKTVERALFRWDKWRQSLVKVWARCDPGSNELASARLQELASTVVKGFGLPDSAILELYWACCVTSRCNIDYEASFDRIVISEAVELPFDPSISGLRIELGMRACPPLLISEKDVVFHCQQYGLDFRSYLHHYKFSPARGNDLVFLDKDHELYPIISELKGRPSKRHQVGRVPNHGDHLAVRCAALKQLHLTYVEIADTLGLKVSRYYLSSQSDVVRSLVHRGEELIRAN